MSDRGVLFVSHDAYRSGSQLALLHFLRWFKDHAKRPFSILLGGGGELIEDFRELAETWSVEQSPWRSNTHRSRLAEAVGLGEWAARADSAELQKFAAKCSPNLVYVNSIASAGVVEVLAPKVPLLTHVHELQSYFQALASPALSRLITMTRRFIACSGATRDNLVRSHGVAIDRIETVHESIAVADFKALRTRQQMFEELRIPLDGLLVLASGTASWRKGADLFIQLARSVCQRCCRAYFAWVGGGTECEIAQFAHDVRVADLGHKVRFCRPVSNPADYVAAADVFVLTSREDPYPLVCLEAAALAKPLICFANAGGAPEFVEDDCGFVVPYLDIMTMADRLFCLLESPAIRLRLGAAARHKVMQRHEVNDVAPRILEIIDRTAVVKG